MANSLWSDVGFQKAARVAVRDCLAVQPGESVLVVTDEPLRDIGELLWQASKEAGAEAVLMEMIPRREHAEEPPVMVAEAMKKAKVVFCPTIKSLSHTQARHEACQAGARVATLPSIRKETFLRALAADYAAIARRSERVSDILTQRHEVHLTTPAGTDLVFSLEGREASPDTGLCHTPGDFSNLPAGEAFIAPVEGTANGVVVVDGTMLETKLASDPVRLVFRDGIAVEIEGGGEVSARLRALVERLGRDAANLAELGVGTNEKAELCGSTLEDEKILGTVHLALGDNSTFGGKVRVASHQDGILLRPTLVVDGLAVLENGKLLVEGE